MCVFRAVAVMMFVAFVSISARVFASV
ncbi:hypothetical protein, conserved in T. vivax [Trypanosoma vivax Y486]|uniref:Uncharacterized protein n=1 Tax=Trypanosoma vivax (strain Y486) TaxID=1055687 RepID=F9WME8_TRYVY|nr:hypothetical protein, conserved in T. vivax [Trypanosoma vivax Y486]|eukprot:CCD18703.1 hypothetical protein, conserved in T. vivax [Trypanosoma vivax Y486]